MTKLALLLPILFLGLRAPQAEADRDRGYATIREDDLAAHLARLASAELEGRDTPSAGLARAAAYVEERFREAGLEGLGAEGSFRLPFERRLTAPVPEACALSFHPEDGAARRFAYGEDFVPLALCSGSAEGEPVFVGFGIREKRERYDDTKGKKLKDRIAVLVAGEPRHRKLFDGPEVTFAADVHRKLEELVERGIAGALVVRRPPPPPKKKRKPAVDLPPASLAYRYTWASWVGENDPRRTRRRLEVPVLEITPETAEALFDQDLLALAERADKSGRWVKVREPEGRLVLESRLEEGPVEIDNVVGVLRGRDPLLAEEYVVVGAHYDHIGVDARGRIGCGADDNASGTSLVIELAEALARSGTRRSVIFCAFAGEEDGLLGSKAFCADPPVPPSSMAAMLNFDMVGRGEESLVALLGFKQNPDLEKILGRAKRLERTGVKKIVEIQDAGLFQRSDHYSFHEIGVPVLFFFEAARIEDNHDYHTWRDTIERLSVEKIQNTARLAFLTTWLLANEDDRPDPPR